MSTEWKKVKLQEICESISDGDHLPPPKAEKGIPFVTISNIKDNQLDFTDTMFVPETYYEKLDNKRKAKTGDILYSVVGSFGIPVLLKRNEKFVFQRHIAILRPNKIESSFLYYTMLGRDFYAKADAAAIGAAQRTVSLTSLRNIEISLPPLETQQKIVGILSAYDDLIENNRKQIKLLEEAAQKLYKEWFIKLNFPGHENTKIVDGVPEGWKKGIISDLGEFKRGKTITKDQTISGVVPVVAGGLEPAYYHNESNTNSPAITVSGSGANAGFTRMYFEKVWASDCSYLDISKCENLFFVYCVLKNSKAEIDNLQKGAAQPHVYAKDLNAINTVIPSKELLEKFSAIVKAYFEKIKAVQKQIQLLQSARDKLLPKLMNGEFEIDSETSSE